MCRDLNPRYSDYEAGLYPSGDKIEQQTFVKQKRDHGTAIKL
jgi:hypothetical protein